MLMPVGTPSSGDGSLDYNSAQYEYAHSWPAQSPLQLKLPAYEASPVDDMRQAGRACFPDSQRQTNTRGHFTPEEDEIIITMIEHYVSQYPSEKLNRAHAIWRAIGAQLNRTATQCRIRYSESLNKSVRRILYTLSHEDD